MKMYRYNNPWKKQATQLFVDENWPFMCYHGPYHMHTLKFDLLGSFIWPFHVIHNYITPTLSRILPNISLACLCWWPIYMYCLLYKTNSVMFVWILEKILLLILFFLIFKNNITTGYCLALLCVTSACKFFFFQ